MEWSGITEQGEAMTLMIHHLHSLGSKAKVLLEPPRHEIAISENVAREFQRKSMQMIQQDPGDELVPPTYLSSGGT